MLLAVSVGGFSTESAVAAPARSPLNGVGRALAQSLDSAGQRAWLRAAIDASPYLEYRIPLRRLMMAERGAAPVRAILDRARLGAGEAATIASLRELELYLPIESQRLAWHGEAGIDVAVRQPDSSYVIYASDGSARAVPEQYHPGARITLTLAPSEIDYADPATALRGGALTGDAMLRPATPDGGAVSPLICTPGSPGCPPLPPPPPPPTGGDTGRHTQMDVLYLWSDHDDPLGGTNEVEIHGSVNGGYNDCGRVTGIRATFYYVIPTAYPNTTLARAIPQPGYRFGMGAYEDDDTACGIRSADDYLGSWSPGIYLDQYTVRTRTSSPGELVLSVHAVTPFE
jgi:hypothetical protein